MKKVVRTVWISLLSGLAFLVACTSSKGLSRAEKKQLKAERTAIMAQIDQKRQESLNVEDPGIMMSYRNEEYKLRERLSEINSRLGDRNAQMENGDQMGNLLTEMDSLQNVIDSNHVHPLLYGPPVVDRRTELTNRLEELSQILRRREGACVYGSPEVIQRYNEETRELRRQYETVQQLLKELDNE